MYVKIAKIHLREKCYDFGTNKEIFMKILNDAFKDSLYVYVKVSSSYLLSHSRNKLSKIVMVGPGRFGPGRLIMDIGSTSKYNNFLFREPHS